MKILNLILVFIFGFLMLFVLSDLPDWGDAFSPVNSYVSRYYLEHSLQDTAVPNVVTSVLADYRSFDTMFETAVVFVAGLAVALILSTFLFDSKKEISEDQSYGAEQSLILTISTRFLVPFMQLFALYVIAHGHHSPGGGFQGGVILGASLILIAIGFDFRTLFTYFSMKSIYICLVLGIFIFSGTGILCVLLGGYFLDYSVLSKIFPFTDQVMARSHAMLIVEIGVGFTVMSAMIFIYVFLSSRGQLDKGL